LVGWGDRYNGEDGCGEVAGEGVMRRPLEKVGAAGVATMVFSAAEVVLLVCGASLRCSALAAAKKLLSGDEHAPSSTLASVALL
jgi:hypothetical protein